MQLTLLGQFACCLLPFENWEQASLKRKQTVFVIFILLPLTPCKFFSQVKNGSKTQFMFCPRFRSVMICLNGSKMRVFGNQSLSFCFRLKRSVYLGTTTSLKRLNIVTVR